MKKTYITPSIKVKKINTSAVMQTASLLGGTQDEVGQNESGYSGGYAKQVLFNWNDNPIEDDELVD